MKPLTFTQRDAARGGAAGAEAIAAHHAAQVLFDAGGRRVLPAAVQRALRGAVERETSRVLTGAAVLEAATPAAAVAARTAEGAARAIVFRSVRAASRQVLRSVTAAAAAGALIDGGWALAHAVGRVRRGVMTRRQAVEHVAREAGTGAAATAAGTAAAVTLVALTGGVAAPAVFLFGAATSMAAKAGLDAWLAARARGAIRAELVEVGPAIAKTPASPPAA
jgi:hypothetical protein